MQSFWKTFRRNDSGSVAAMTALGLFALLGVVGLALDIGHIIGVKGELQRAADASALAGARGLYPDILNNITYGSPPNCAQAEARAGAAAANNPIEGTAPAREDTTVETGTWDYSTRQFIQQCNSFTNTVRVTIRKNGVPMAFARIFGINAVDESASATAVMDWVRGVGAGTVPIAINEDYAKSGNPEKITFNPSTSDVGGWFSVPPDSASASTLSDYINNGSCPPIKVGDIISLNNGVITSVLQLLAQKLAGHGGSWDVTLPVVDSTQFNENKPVKGFLVFRVTQVDATGGDKFVKGIPLSLGMGPGASVPGGANYGVLAPPRLVN